MRKEEEMTKSGDTAASSEERPETTLTEVDVLAFLRAHPDFLARHPDVIAEMSAPGRWSGNGIVDMQQFLIDRRGIEMDQLRDAAQDVIETSRSNMSTQTRTHGAVLSLLAARAWGDMLRVITHDWPLLLDIDAVVLGFESGEESVQHLMETDVRSLPPGLVDSVLSGGQEVRLYREINDDGTIFAAAAGLVNSAALARIQAGSNWPVGLLALGARDDSFHPGQGTELISFLCRVLEESVARTLETDAV